MRPEANPMKDLAKALLRVLATRATGWWAAGISLLLVVLGEASLPTAIDMLRQPLG